MIAFCIKKSDVFELAVVLPSTCILRGVSDQAKAIVPHGKRRKDTRSSDTVICWEGYDHDEVTTPPYLCIRYCKAIVLVEQTITLLRQLEKRDIDNSIV